MSPIHHHHLALLAVFLAGFGPVSAALTGSAFAGSTSTAVFPPANVTQTIPDEFFPGPSDVGFAGPTPTGDEAEAIATAPVAAQMNNIFPLVKPDTSDKKGSKFDVAREWGNLSPFQSTSFGLDTSPQVPDGCELTQVHLLHRHGARYPTSGSFPAQFAAALHAAATGHGFTVSGPLKFLDTWTYKLGAEILTPFGRLQLFELGVGFRVKYGELLKKFTDLPVWRTTSEARMVDSALHFAAGFFGLQDAPKSYHQLIEVEASGFNSTLAPYEVCPNNNNEIANFGIEQSAKWVVKYLAPAQKRLQPFIQGLTLNATWLFAMQQTCAYETVALGYSAFCDLFTEEEWKGYSYANDLQIWYGNGPGNPATSALGRGWVQELVSRLDQTRITSFDSTVNGTIVSSNITFPLNQPIFVDATHDTVITSIITAMNFTSLAANGPLPTDRIPENQTYFVNQLAPFASNLVGQVLSCPSSNSSTEESAPTHIRWILNDGVVPLTGINGCQEAKDGRCELPAFIQGMKERIQEIDFTFDCFANYTIPQPDTITTGQFPQ